MNTLKLDNAIGQFFELPITFNPAIAKVVGSTKAAMLFDYIMVLESHAFTIPNTFGMAEETGLGLFETKTALSKLLQFKLLLDDGGVTVNPFYFDELETLLTNQGYSNYENLLTSIAINRLYMRTILNQGGSVNAGVLLSIIHGTFEEWQLNSNSQYSDWIQLQDNQWMQQSGMSIKEYKTAKKFLYRFGYLDKCREGFPSSTYIRMDLTMLANKTWEFATISRAQHQLSTQNYLFKVHA